MGKCGQQIQHGGSDIDDEKRGHNTYRRILRMSNQEEYILMSEGEVSI